MASPTRWTWVWVDSGCWWWTGGLACCDSWGRKEPDETERLNWTELMISDIDHPFHVSAGHLNSFFGEKNVCTDLLPIFLTGFFFCIELHIFLSLYWIYCSTVPVSSSGFSTSRHVVSQLPKPGVEHAPPSLEGEVPAIGPPGKSQIAYILDVKLYHTDDLKVFFPISQVAFSFRWWFLLLWRTFQFVVILFVYFCSC